MHFNYSHSLKHSRQKTATKTHQLIAPLFVLILAVILRIAPAVHAQIAHQETKTGGSSDNTAVTTSASLTAQTGHLYLAAISTRPKMGAQSVTGLGLTWTLVKTKCSGRNSTGIQVWKAQGTPSGNDVVTATFANAPKTAVIAVSRYSGAASVNPVSNAIAGNTNGLDASGTCSGGVNTNAYSFNLNTTVNKAVVYSAAVMNARTHTPGAGYVERGEVKQTNGTFASSVAVQDTMIASPATVAANGSFSGVVDWAMVALQIKPRIFKLTATTVGSGSVTLNPPGVNYSAGTVVTLTATPAAGFQFSGWSGNLSGSTNPANILMNGNKNVTATFTEAPAQFTLTANIVGSGTVTLDPPGGTYNSGTEVTLTANPAGGFQFSGWSGDLSGSTNPANLTMNASKNVTATFTSSGSSGPITHHETQTGGSTASTTVSTVASLTAESGQLYLAAISTRGRVAVTGVSGLGLSWTLVKAQCAGRNLTGVEVWMAQGTPSGNGIVTATLASTPSNAVIAVSRYSGVNAEDPVGNSASANTNGINGLCSGGVDTSFYSFNLSTTADDAVVYGAVAIRSRVHIPGAGYTERAELLQGTLGAIAGVAVEEKPVATPSTVTVNGSFNGIVDWAAVAVEIRPEVIQASVNLTVHTVGTGTVALNPDGGNYASGTEVTLTATPAAGFQFSGWSGDLSGSDNPETIVMDSHKDVTAIFTSDGPPDTQVTHKETRTGGSSSSGTVTTAVNLTGVSGDLYLAAISTRPRVAVTAVSGLGLTWTLVKTQCAGRNLTGVEVWKAQGTPSSFGTVTATLASVPSNAAIAVSRYSGVDTDDPVGNSASSNTNGVDGLCSGGVDTSFYSFNLSTTEDGAVVYGAIAMRSRVHIPGAGYTERAEFYQGTGGAIAGVAVEDKYVATTSTATVNGSFNGIVDWAVVALEIKPQTMLGKQGETSKNATLAAPAEYQLMQNYPNPFNPSTTIDFALPVAGAATLKIYNEAGQLVRTLVAGEKAAGQHTLRWNGRNQAGQMVAAGMYLYQLIVSGENGAAVFMQTRRMMFLE
ncbi:MAG: InlB B-repeat-containing protein [bacterium]